MSPRNRGRTAWNGTGTDSGRGVLEPHRLLRPRLAVWCFCSRSTPFTLAVALTFVRTLSGEHRIRGYEKFAWDEGEGDDTRRVVAHCSSPVFRSASGA
jgi:hypothetical protein